MGSLGTRLHFIHNFRKRLWTEGKLSHSLECPWFLSSREKRKKIKDLELVYTWTGATGPSHDYFEPVSFYSARFCNVQSK